MTTMLERPQQANEVLLVVRVGLHELAQDRRLFETSLVPVARSRIDERCSEMWRDEWREDERNELGRGERMREEEVSFGGSKRKLGEQRREQQATYMLS
jgi:hypothetical protein